MDHNAYRGLGMQPRPITLEFVAHAEITLGEISDVGPVPTGHRRVIPITGGHLGGPLLDATILPGGADWQIVSPDGTAIIDSRYSAATADGAQIYIATQGFRYGPPEVIARLAAGDDVARDDYSFRLSARIECGSPDLMWVNRTIFVATAARQRASVTYDLYSVN